MRDSDIRLNDKKILVTGVSRSMGIGTALTISLAQAGATVAIHGYSPYDREMAYPDTCDSYAIHLADELLKDGYHVYALPSSDLSLKNTPDTLISIASERFGHLDGLVLNHAYSTNAGIEDWTADHIDAHLITNVRASMLMLRAFAKQLPANVPASVTLFTSGQYLGPMIDEIAYAVSKDAIIGLCRQAAVALASRGIRVNCINPGPTDTGYFPPDSDLHKKIAAQFPSGKWGTPEDAAHLVLFLQSESSRWITGQVIASEGGFRRDLG